MAGKPLDGVSLLNERWGRDGTGLLVLSGTGDDPYAPPGNRCLLIGSVWEIRQADGQISPSFAYVGGKSFLTGKSALSPGRESQADMPVIWAILQEYYPGVLSEHGADAQPSIIGAVLLAGCWSDCDLLPQTGCLHMARR